LFVVDNYLIVSYYNVTFLTSTFIQADQSTAPAYDFGSITGIATVEMFSPEETNDFNSNLCGDLSHPQIIAWHY